MHAARQKRKVESFHFYQFLFLLTMVLGPAFAHSTKSTGYLPLPTSNRHQVTLSTNARTNEKKSHHLVDFLFMLGFEHDTSCSQPTSLTTRPHGTCILSN